MALQIILTATILIAAVVYAAWRVYQALRKDGDPCSGCELKKNCKKFGSIREK